MNFIKWATRNQEKLSQVLSEACNKEPKYFDDPDGRFMKDKFHIYALKKEFIGIFDRIESSCADLVYLPTGELVSLKSQGTIFQYPAKKKELYAPTPVIIVNCNSTYGDSDMQTVKDKLCKVDYWLLYNKQTKTHNFSLGIIDSSRMISKLELSGSQFKARLFNKDYNLLYHAMYKESITDRDEQSRIYFDKMNVVFDALLS